MKNVIIVNTHDTGTFISPYGYKLPTKGLESFAQDAIVFENCFCASPTCSPSRASFMTGTYNNNNGMIGLAHRNFNLKNRQQHLANILKSHGFETVLCGIQHENGFFEHDNYIQLSSELGYQKNITASLKDYKTDAEQLLWDDENTNLTCDFIRKYDFSNKPLFLQLGMFATHRDYPKGDDNSSSFYSKPSQFTNFDTDDVNGLYKSLENADKNFTRVYETLKETGQLENTVFIYTTDHGLADPYAKCYLTDAGTKVSLIVRFPGLNTGLYKNLISQVNFVPTLLEYLEISVNYKFDENSQLQYIRNNLPVKNDIFTMINFHTSYEPCRSIRTERYKLIKYYDKDHPFENYSNTDTSIYKDEYLKMDKNKDMNQLYDLLFDPLEKNNLFTNELYNDLILELERKLYDKQTLISDEVLELNDFIGKHKINKQTCVVTGSKDPMDYL